MNAFTVAGLALVAITQPITESPKVESAEGWAISASSGEWVLRTRSDHASIQIGCTRDASSSKFIGYVRAAEHLNAKPFTNIFMNLAGSAPIKLPVTHEFSSKTPIFIWNPANVRQLRDVVERLSISGQPDTIDLGESAVRIISSTPSDVETISIFKSLCFGVGSRPKAFGA